MLTFSPARAPCLAGSTARTCRARGPPEKPGGLHARIAFVRSARKPGLYLIDKVSMALYTFKIKYQIKVGNDKIAKWSAKRENRGRVSAT